MLSIRMTRVGSKKKPFFRLVVTEARSKRESSYIDTVGTYNPRLKSAKVEIDTVRIQHWISKGAKPSDSVRTLLGNHLTRDLSPAALEAEAAAKAATSAASVAQ